MGRFRSAVFFLSYFLHFFTFWMVLAYLPLLLASYGIADQQIGFAIGLNSLSSILLVLPFGVLSDYFSPKRTLTFGAVCYSAYFLLLLTLKDFVSICLVLVIGGVGAAAVRVILTSLYLKLMGGTGRGKKVAFLQLGGYLGFGLGPLVGGYVYETFGAGLMIKGAWGLSIVIIVLTQLLKDPPPVVFSFRDYRRDIKEPNVLFLVAVVFVLGTHFGAEQTSISLLMKDIIGLTKRQIGVIFFVLGAWMALLVPFAGRLMDKRHSVFLFLLVGLLISSCFQFITAFTHTFYSLLIVRVIHTMGDTLAILESDVLTAQFFPAGRLGGNSGLIFCVRTSAIFLFAAFSGWLNQGWGYKMPFIINGIMVFAFTLTALLYRDKAVQLRAR
ncbi:MAG: MFS transporter [Thermodesulfobacteriota bacterium]|nr:MFS transporter [Thermodesulfobacteriota bacterium]